MLKHKVPGSRKVLVVMEKNTKYTNQGGASGISNEVARAFSGKGTAWHTEPATAEAYFDQGRTNFDAGRYSEAFNDFTKAIVINPEYAEAFCHRANARIMLINKTPQN